MAASDIRTTTIPTASLEEAEAAINDVCTLLYMVETVSDVLNNTYLDQGPRDGLIAVSAHLLRQAREASHLVLEKLPFAGDVPF